MALTAPPVIPQITDPATFATRSQDWVVWQSESFYPFLEDGASLIGLSTSGTSTTSNTIGTGSKSFTTQTGKGFFAGMSLSIARTSDTANRMLVRVDSYNSGTGALVVTSQVPEGSGTFTDWSIAIAVNAIVSNAQISNSFINDLTAVTFNPLADYVAIADGSDSGNKKKAFINSVGIGDSTDTITDSGANGTRTLVLDGVIREVQTAAARTSTIDAGSTLYPEFKCRAWVNFNGTGTVAIRASGNVSSITDNGVGDYIINFTTAMPDANYAVMGMGSAASAGGTLRMPDAYVMVNTSVRINLVQSSGATIIDANNLTLAVIR